MDQFSPLKHPVFVMAKIDAITVWSEGERKFTKEDQNGKASKQ